MKTKIRNSISGLLFIPLLIGCFALLPSVQAAPDPAPPPGNNTRDGAGAMANITTGTGNTAFGTNALNKLTTGDNNAAQGNSALFSCTDGNSNTAVGSIALRFLTVGDQNVAIGNTALNNITNGSFNTAVGYGALRSGATANSNNTAVGWSALISNNGGENTALGFLAGGNNVNGSNNIYIGDLGFPSESNTIAIGAASATGTAYTACFIGGAFGVTDADSIPLRIDPDGHLATATSSARFKKDIKPMDKASESILALKPVTFHYKNDAVGIPQFGLVAEDVEKVNSDLVSRDKEGKAFTVRYEEVNAMLLNEFIKEHRKVQELEATVASLATAVKEQAAQLQKVSAQLEVSKPAPRTVANK